MPASPSVERVVVVGGCPAERQDAVMAAARLQPHLLHVGFVKDAVSTDHAGCGAGATAQDRAIHVLIPTVEAFERNLVSTAVAVVSSYGYDVSHLQIVNIAGGKNCEKGLLVRRAKIVRDIRQATGLELEDLRVTIEMQSYDQFVQNFGTVKHRAGTGHRVTTIATDGRAADEDEASVKVPSRADDDRPPPPGAPRGGAAKRAPPGDDSALIWGGSRLEAAAR